LVIKLIDYNEDVIDEVIKIILLSEIEFNKLKDGINIIMNSEQNEAKKRFLKEIVYNRINTDKTAINNNEKNRWIDFVLSNMNYLDLVDQVNLLISVAIYYKNNKEIEKTFKCFRELLIKDSNKENIVFSEVIHILQEYKILDKDLKMIIDNLRQLSEICKNLKIKNVFLNEAEILEGKSVLESKPRQMVILITMKCNLRCIMCCNGYEKEYELDDELYSFIIKNLPYLEKIDWKGGEVFLYKNFLNLVHLANKYKVSQTIVTNALLLDKDKIDFLVENNVHLSISIDAVNQQLYETIRVGGKFNKLIEVLNILRDLNKSGKKISYSMNTVLMSVNFNTISDIVDFAVKYEFDYLNLLKCNNYPQEDKSLLLNDDQIYYIYKQLNKKIREIPNDFKIVTDMPFFLDVKNDVDDKNLNANKSEEVIKEKEDTNDYYKKVFCSKPWQIMMIDIRDISFGCQCRTLNVSKYSFEKDDIWNCEELVDYRKSILKNKEKACKIFLENNYK
jgi:MoaA/NifB/PqqE/SkfB family radical SAM enzyme